MKKIILVTTLYTLHQVNIVTIRKLATSISAALLLATSALQAESDYTIHKQDTSDHPPLAPGVIHVPSYDLPLSTLLSEETKASILKTKKEWADTYKCPGGRYPGRNKEEILTFRKCADDRIAKSAAKVQKRYGVQIVPKTIAGVYTEIFTPNNGVPEHNKNRLIINVHGGGFVLGARVSGRTESIPVSAMGEFKVISIDYRQFPEYSYPAASEDVLAVYEELLKSYKPENMAIYGCSAGGALTASALARIRKEGLPTPAAAGIFCFGATGTAGTADSYLILSPIDGINPLDYSKYPSYNSNANPNDPLYAPAMHPDVLAKFPPTLLMSSVRDRALSTVAFTHTQLLKVGVEADLVVWEGLQHGGFLNPDIQEYVDSHKIIVRFFDKHLGVK